MWQLSLATAVCVYCVCVCVSCMCFLSCLPFQYALLLVLILLLLLFSLFLSLRSTITLRLLTTPPTVRYCEDSLYFAAPRYTLLSHWRYTGHWVIAGNEKADKIAKDMLTTEIAYEVPQTRHNMMVHLRSRLPHTILDRDRLSSHRLPRDNPTKIYDTANRVHQIDVGLANKWLTPAQIVTQGQMKTGSTFFWNAQNFLHIESQF